MVVLQVCAYGAEYAGNFIASLEVLEAALAKKGIRTVYAFIERASDKEWCKQIQKRTKVYFLPEANARILPKTYKVFKDIYKENQVDIVHCHFELYDIPASVTAPKSTKIFWHLHDPIDISKQKPSRQILTKLQYGVIGKKATLLSVAEEYRKRIIDLGFPEEKAVTIVNGLDLNRVVPVAEARNVEYEFLTFGWDFHRKGGDMIIDACRILEQEGYRFKLLFNGNTLTWTELDEYLNGIDHEWLCRGEPVENINELFNVSGVFIQASRRETFSYAVCEAAYAGLPVISTDIAGLEWAHDLPTVDFVPKENANALYLAMKQYLEGKRFLPEMYVHSRNTIEEKYSTREWMRKILSYYGV